MRTDETTKALETAETEPPPEPSPKKARRGFATWTPEERREIARQGGKAAHANGTAHQWTTATAREAGRKGGVAHHVSRGPRGKRRAAGEAV